MKTKAQVSCVVTIQLLFLCICENKGADQLRGNHTVEQRFYFFGYCNIYTASKVKHHLNIFLEKTVKLSKHEFIFITCLKRDKVVTIYSKFWFDYHLGKRSGKENAHSPLKMSRFSTPLWHFQTDRRCLLLVSYCCNTKDMFCLKISNEYL